MDELFEALTLVQTGKVTRFPVVLLGTAYWQGLLDWLREHHAGRGQDRRRATWTCSASPTTWTRRSATSRPRPRRAAESLFSTTVLALVERAGARGVDGQVARSLDEALDEVGSFV